MSVTESMERSAEFFCRSVRWVALVGICSILSGCEVAYVIQQGVGQIAMLAQREPIAHVLQEPTLPSRVRDRLVLIWHVREFARHRLGLRVGESYRDLVRLNRDAASYVVSAAPRDRLEPYLWCFPIAGCLPYIGYFRRVDAEREAQRLARQGYDVHVRGVEAYSLGGWFPDPVYSPMLDDSRWWLANTVLHELTHGTVFVPGRARFNEGLATFVGDTGSLLFLEERYGARSATVAEARAEQRDRRRYVAFLEELITELRRVYALRISREEKLRRREEWFERAVLRAREIPFELPVYARAARRRFNNAMLVTHMTYHGSERQFEAVYQRLGRDLRRFVVFIRDEVARQPDPENYLNQWLRSH